MKILVSVKKVVDYNVNIRIKADGSGVETDHVKMSMNPFDEIAVEEAVRQKQAGHASEICAVACGVEKSQDTLRTALAIGADNAILVKTEQELQPLAVAKLLCAVIKKQQPNLVIIGKQNTDDDTDQTGQMLAALLNWPQATAVTSVDLDEKSVRVTVQTDDAEQTLELMLPAVITADLRLNEPRYVTLPNMMKARKKPIEVTTPEELSVCVDSRLKTVRVDSPPERSQVQMLDNIDALVDKLKNEAKVI